MHFAGKEWSVTEAFGCHWLRRNWGMKFSENKEGTPWQHLVCIPELATWKGNVERGFFDKGILKELACLGYIKLGGTCTFVTQTGAQNTSENKVFLFGFAIFSGLLSAHFNITSCTVETQPPLNPLFYVNWKSSSKNWQVKQVSQQYTSTWYAPAQPHACLIHGCNGSPQFHFKKSSFHFTRHKKVKTTEPWKIVQDLLYCFISWI